jgi:hypothetical protein
MRVFRRRDGLTEVRSKQANPRERLKNLKKARQRVSGQLANPNLNEQHRPRLEERALSMDKEISELEMMFGG